jgi:YD repeat-containing protein
MRIRIAVWLATAIVTAGGAAHAQSDPPTLNNGGGGQGWSSESEMRAAMDQAGKQKEHDDRMAEEAAAWLMDLGSLKGASQYTIGNNLFNYAMDPPDWINRGGTTYLTCSANNDASYGVPFGAYSNSNLIAAYDARTTSYDDIGRKTITHGYSIYPREMDTSTDTTGWNFEPGGTLRETWALVNLAVDQSIPTSTCSFVQRYNYQKGSTLINFQTAGVEPLCRFTLDGSFDDSDCKNNALAQCPSPTTMWSDHGQILLDLSSLTSPTLRFPDGTVEVMGLAPTGSTAATAPFVSTMLTHGGMATNGNRFWFSQRVVDSNGNTTSYHYDPSTGWADTVTSPTGVVTTYKRTLPSSSKVTSITVQGIGGALQTWTMSWQTSTLWHPSTVFPDFACSDVTGLPIACPDLAFSSLASLTIPDGRAYTFSYLLDPTNGNSGSWPYLTRISTPDGEVVDYHYGTSATYSFPLWQRSCPAPVSKILSRRLISTTEYPQGLAGTSYQTTFDQIAPVANPVGGTCPQIYSTKQTNPDQSYVLAHYCLQDPNSENNGLNGRPLAQEAYSSGGQLLSGTYYGDMVSGSSTYGQLWAAWETASANALFATGGIPGGAYLDVRPTQVKHVRDGLAWWEKYTYGDSTTIAADNGAVRTYGNETVKSINADCSGSPCAAPLAQTATAYQYDAKYSTTPHQNLIRLPISASVEDGSGNVLTRTDRQYDCNNLTSGCGTLPGSGQSGLTTTYIVNGQRGDLTKSTSYRDYSGGTINTGGTTATSTSAYYDNGAVYRTQNPVDFGAGRYTSTVTFGNSGAWECSMNPKPTITVANALGQTNSTVHDCFTGATLSVTDANGQKSCRQYDGFGREVEQAAPGDILTALPLQTPGVAALVNAYVRDSSCSTVAGSTVGGGGAGPTAWTRYYPLGIGGVTYNQARTVTASRDGTSNGHEQVSFVDGLGRSIQQCSEVDPHLSVLPGGGASGDSAVCTTSVYDGMGRVVQQYVPFYSGTTMPSSVVATPSADQYTQSSYDALGRVTSVQLMKSGLPATLTAYSSAGGNWLTTVTDANLCQVQTKTDALGHTVEHDVQNGALNASGQCSGASSWLATSMKYDALGRLLTVTDPASNETKFQYDGLNRKTAMVDPDMGTWTYGYDSNGNLTSQKDARGATINLSYDVLNRVWLKDLPYLMGTTWVNGPGEEDEVTYYDSTSNLPGACYSNCDDHCSTTKDNCLAATLTCTHSGPTAGCPDLSSGCAPSCAGKCGGSDGCSGTCPNDCVSPQTCGGAGTADVCGCTPNCTGKCGGSDGCTGTCPNDCVSPQTCGGAGTANVCGCAPSCSGKCGLGDGCGGTCCVGNSNCTEVSCNQCTDGTGRPCYVENACGSACTKVCNCVF